jgi:hypothetical protein
MRIIIDGPITPERLIEALERAALKFEGVLGDRFEGFYGANLYVQAYSTDGRQVEIPGPRGAELVLKLALPEGSIKKPALSD